MYCRTFMKPPLQYVKVLLGKHPPFLLKIFHPKLTVLPQRFILSAANSTFQLRFLSNRDGDPILEPEIFEDHVFEENLSGFSFKHVLYPEEDHILKRINACCSSQKLLDMFAKDGAQFQPAHVVQTVILLWDFCRKLESQTSEAQKVIKEDEKFEILLAKLLEAVEDLNPNEMTCCYLYLKRIGLDPKHKLMQQLMVCILETIKKGDNIPLSALSRFSVAVSTDKTINTSLVCRNMLPHLVKALETCSTAEEMRLITICLINIRQLVLKDFLEVYKAKVKELMKLKILNTENTKCVLKVLHFLNHPSWSHLNSSLSRKLMLLVLPIIDDLSEEDVKIVYKLYQSQLEPAAMAPKLLKFAEPKKKERLIEIFKSQLSDETMWQRPTAPLYFFTILRSLKISDNELCNKYWTKVLEDVDRNPEGKEHYVFAKHCHRYMYFNNNLGGTYRHLEFEKRMAHLCMNEISTGISGVIPSKFSNLASFVLGYGHTYRGNSIIPNSIMSKIETMKSQFSPDDCLHLSRGIQIAFEMRFRHFVPTMIAQQLEIIEKALSESAKRHLNTLNHDNAKDLNVIIRSLNNRKSPRKSSIYQQALNKYNHINANALDSRMLRDMSYNLSTSNFVAPEVLEKMFSYIMKNENYVTGDTAEKIISCSYNLGYSPQLQESLDSIARIVVRDFDYMTGLSIIQASLALCFYKTIPEKLINKVFCVDFIKRIEEEIEMCYSKATYPERVLNQVMQLNRAVCLDFPEADVPWFQQNYLEAQLSKYPFVPSKYNDDVKQGLLSVLKDESLFRCNHVTPYGYRIDFVIHFDTQKHPIPAPVETTVLDKITKVAILLLKLDSMCENDLLTMRGKEALRMRHLEMLGYKVVHINQHDWTHLKVQNERANYLKCLLQITS
ncbi:FAST kinase domain-containing protein 1, mitochondrial isoform X2 [Eupeodes corollae]|uniref:FAST kinase domain-containing protein 1, mitochondrial isoform X2 n=1 Tax=Eupeodes corollae TaxID=290404 RepID=UPI00248F9D29|nr:FAST kinase domain-containing protein 1, mitochondrial isoform X2 [Eupeodes corollae]